MSELAPEVVKLLSRDSFRLTPATLAMKLSYGTWKPARHLLHISGEIAHALYQGGARIIVSLPPRHGKSKLLSVYTPLWVLDLWPQFHIILCSYGADLANEFGQEARDIAAERQDILNFTLRQDSQRVNRWLTTRGGRMITAGVGGPIVGRGANVLLIDDFLKNAKDASSEQIRNDQYDWLLSAALTRLEPNGSVIILAQRWHVDDLIGRIQTQHPGEWKIIRMEALNESLDDPLGREIGEPLWPERYSRAYLETQKKFFGDYFWKALYQQAPILPGAGLNAADKLIFIDTIPPSAKLELVRAWDLAGTPADGDFTVGALLGYDKTQNRTYILHLERFRLGPSDTEERIKSTAERDGHSVKIVMEQEPGAAGKIVIDHYSKVLRGFRFKGNRPTGPKFVRAQPLCAGIQAGDVYAIVGEWNQDYKNEMMLFPDGAHDDQVDATAAAYNELHGKKYAGVLWGNRPKVMGHNGGPTLIMPDKQVVTGAVWGRR